MESGGSRRRRTLSDEKLDSPNLRDFLRVKEDIGGRNSLSGLTLGAILGSERRLSTVQVNRTLLDIIRDDPSGSKEGKKSWKAFKDKLRLRRAGVAWTSTVSIPTSDLPMQNTNRMNSRRNSTRFPTTTVNSNDPTSESDHPDPSSSSTSINGRENGGDLNSMPSNRAMMLRSNSSRVPSLSANRYGRGADGSTSLYTSENGSVETAELNRRVPATEGAFEEDSDEAEEGGGETEESTETAEEGGEPPVRMSLMSLLAETDREMGLDGSIYVMEEEEEEEEEEGSGGAEFYNCCVCMVRHKGAALIPCGHTFCRLCSRELWVQRGNCPLCNGFILEILDIF